MGPLQAQTETRGKDSPADFHPESRPFRFAGPADGGDTTGRHEPQFLVERIVPRDPYAAWLEQREAERELEDRPRIRWVHRPRGQDDPGILARRL